MPKTDGFGVLRWVRARPELDTLRVVVLTSSENMRDVSDAYKFGADSFLMKPFDFTNTISMTKTMTDYWLGLNATSGLERT